MFQKVCFVIKHFLKIKVRKIIENKEFYIFNKQWDKSFEIKSDISKVPNDVNRLWNETILSFSKISNLGINIQGE